MIKDELNQIEINVTVSLQEKGGIYQAVLSYKDLSNKWKTKWQSTSIKVKSGNKKLQNKKLKVLEKNLKKKCEKK